MDPVEPPLPVVPDRFSPDVPQQAAPRIVDPGDGRALRKAPERREVALVLGFVLLLYIVPGGLLQTKSLRWGILVTQVLFIAAPVVLAIRWFYLDRRAILPVVRPSGRVLAGAALGALGLNHALNCLVLWQDRIIPMPEVWRRQFEDLETFHGPVDFLLLLVLVGVVPGICEEVMFRGFVHSGLRHSFESGTKAVVVGSLVFAGFHLDPWRFDVLLVIGLYLGFLVQRTGSLVPSMVAHALNNMLSVALSGLGDETQTLVVQTAGSHVLACLCLLGAALLLRRAPA